jgi:hypothetical protein
VRKYTRNLVIVFFVAAILSFTCLLLLSNGDDLPYVEGGFEDRYIVSISLYNALSLAGLFVLVRFVSKEPVFIQRMCQMVAIFIACVVVRAPLMDDWPPLDELIVAALWESGRAIGVAFAVAYMAHRIYSRYLPTTLLRARDITPVLIQGKPVTRPRRNHARNAQWLFDMRDRKYLDSTKLRLKTVKGEGFEWGSWVEATFWSGVLLLSFSIYSEVYPRVADTFDLVLTSVMAGHLLTLIPLVLLPSYSVDRLGATISVEGKVYHLADGFRHTAFRWTKLSFIPIIVVALLVRGDLVEQDWASLADALLISVPTAALTNLVYLDCFRNRTVARIHEAIPEHERAEDDEWGPEPWRERSLMEGVEIVEVDMEID